MTRSHMMTEKLVVNPLAAIERSDDGTGFISGGPVPGRGMKFLQIDPDENPRLHALLDELSRIGLANLDIDGDLNEEETRILQDHGILIAPDRVPERPLFACPLDRVTVDPSAAVGSVVNPTLEFEPFDLSKFRTWMSVRHLSPHQATAWVTDGRTGARWGYWLSPEQADAVAQLTPGSHAKNIDSTLAARLTAAAILSGPSAHPLGDHPSEEVSFFVANRYAVIEQIVPTAQLNALRSYYAKYWEQGFMKLGDDQVPLRFVQHDEPVARMVHYGLSALMSKLAGATVKPTYCYSAVYTEGAELAPHVDREDCEYSFSLQLDYSPAPANAISPWALYLADVGGDPLRVDPKRDKAVYLSNGSCLAYMGRELVHYRGPLAEGHRSTSLFFHYVPI